jgi:hypothetical protein
LANPQSTLSPTNYAACHGVWLASDLKDKRPS